MPTITPLATLTPPCTSRTWLSAPHPHLPVLATACSDKTVRIYSLQNFQQQNTISGGHKRSIRSCAWKPNSVGESVLATGSFDASAGIWRRWEEGGGAGKIGGVGETDFTAGLAGGDEDGGADAEEEDEWRFAVILDGHDSEIKSLSFCPTAPLLATCSRDKSIWIWEELEDDNFETVAVLQEHEGDVKCVAWHPGELLLASGSYDDHVRLWREDVDDWACCAMLRGHGGTVWWVEFEGADAVGKLGVEGGEDEGRIELLARRKKAGPRLMSCSDDHMIKVWRRVPKDDHQAAGQRNLPSIWKTSGFEEDWVEEATLPIVHERSVYAISWSAKTGMVASTGSDGKIVVYEERWKQKSPTQDVPMTDRGTATSDGPLQNGSKDVTDALTEWVVVAELDNAHDVYEVNHIVWAPRADKGKQYDGEEVLVTTGDDGEVKVWIFET